jgi:phosphoadenosine phosphosulfate reductase
MEKTMRNLDLGLLNKELEHKSPEEIINWALSSASAPVVTTNFRPYEVAILYACTQVKNDLKVIWCDTGYNTPQTYKHANQIIEKLDLDVHLYVPKQTAAHRDSTLGIPQIEDPQHKIFTEQVKLEPFNRAMKEHKPDVWFTNLRKGQTAFRDNIGIVSISKDGVLKVSPFYHWTDEMLDTYLTKHKLPNEFTYFDPTKVLENRECGLHS